jgi:hypothetical protein
VTSRSVGGEGVETFVTKGDERSKYRDVTKVFI